MTESWQNPTELVRSRLAPAGLDLVHPLRAIWYNRVVRDHPLPDFDRADTLVLLVGNTRALWPRFLDALRKDPKRLEDDHPIDDYTMTRVSGALHDCPFRHEIRWAHDISEKRIAIQRLAHASGFAWLSPAHLNIHPVYGPWIALRAAIVLDAPGPAAPPPLEDPCGDCDAGCMPFFDRAVREAGEVVGTDRTQSERWRHWLSIRDACPVGREYRYSDEQIRYHYTKDRSVLEKAIQGKNPA